MARARPFRSLSVSVLIVCALLALTALPTVAAAHSACSGGGAVELGVGFRDLADLLGALVGEPLECEHADASTGDVVQQTSTGLLYWRKSTNTPTFTNGDQHWALRGEQILQWSGDSVDPPDDAESPRAEAQAQWLLPNRPRWRPQREFSRKRSLNSGQWSPRPRHS